MINFAEFKKFFMFNLIGSLILASLVAVVTVLIGEFNEIAYRAIMTLVMVILHSVVALAFIWEDEKKNTFERLTIFTNVSFLFIVVSFITSIFNIWDLIGVTLAGDLYMTYLVLLFAALHVDILSKALDKEGYLDMIIYSNYLFIAIVVLMLLPVIYMTDVAAVFGQFYFRFLSAAGIIDATLSILTIILYKLYMYKHPKEENPLQEKKKGMSTWVWVLIIYLVFQIGFSIILSLFYGF